MAEHNGIRPGQVDPQDASVVEQDFALSGVEEDVARGDLDPEGQSMLSQQPAPACRILDQHCNPAVVHVMFSSTSSTGKPRLPQNVVLLRTSAIATS
jgi:hypothetical protein